MPQHSKPHQHDASRALLEGRSRETQIKRNEQGQWFNGEDAITHPQVIASFDSWLCLAPDGSGRMCLANSVNWAYVSIEGPAYRVLRVSHRLDTAPPSLHATLSNGRAITLKPKELCFIDDNCVEYTLENGLVARFSSQAMHDIGPLLSQDAQGHYVVKM